jgi:DNA polymerase-3 subunit alpha
MLGLYVSEHPLMGAERALRRHVDATVLELRELRDGELRTVGGIVTTLARKYTRRGELMATFVLEDLAASVEVMVFPKTMAQYGHLLEDDAVVCVKGRLDGRDDEPKLVAMELRRPELVLDSGPPVRIRARLQSFDEAKVAALKDLLAQHPGDSPVFVHLEGPEKVTVVRIADDFSVGATGALYAELRVLLGADCIL